MKNQYSSVLYNCTLFKLNKGSPVTFSGTSKLKRKPNHSFFFSPSECGISRLSTFVANARRLDLAIHYQFQIQLRYNSQKPSGPVLSFIISLITRRYWKQMIVPINSLVFFIIGVSIKLKITCVHKLFNS